MKISPRPTRFVLLVLCAQELSTLPQTSSLSLSVAGCNNIHRPLPSAPASHTQERDFSTIFSNFQTLLAAFFPQQVHTDNLATFFEKTLAMVQLEDVSSTAPRARALTPGAVSPLSASILCSERQ